MADKSVTVTLKASVASYLTSMAAASKATSGFRGSLMTLGAGMTKFVTLPVLAAGAGALKVAMDWESAFAGVRKTVEATAPQLARLEEGLRGLARQLPATHDEIAGVAEAAGQLGIAFPRIEAFTRTMIDMGETTDLSADQAAQAMARIANIMQMPQTEFERLGSTIVDLGNKGAATEAEIVEMSLRIAGAGHQLGLTEAEVASFGEALSSVGIRAEAGGSAISRAFIEINEHVNQAGRELDILAEIAGTSVPEFARLFEQDAAEAMTLFVEGLGKVDKTGGDVFATLEDLGLSEIRTRDALLRLAGAGDLLRNSLVTGNKAWEENTALLTEAEKRYATTESQLKVTVNQIKDLGITIGNKLLPAGQGALSWVRDLLKGFTDLSPAMQDNILKWGLIAAAVGPALMIFSKLLGIMKKVPVLVGIAGAVDLVKTLYDNTQLAIDAAEDLGQAFEESFREPGAGFEQVGEVVSDLEGKLIQLRGRLDEINIVGDQGVRGPMDIWNKFKDIVADIGPWDSAREAIAKLHQVMGDELRQAAEDLPGPLNDSQAAMLEAKIEARDYAGALELLTRWEQAFLDEVKRGQRGMKELTTETDRLAQAGRNQLQTNRQNKKATEEAAAANARLGADVRRLGDYIGNLPKKHKTDIEANTQPARSEIEAFIRQVTSRTYTLTFTAQREGGVPVPEGQHGFRNFAGGMAVVGEAGPEVVNLPRGSDVIPNHQLGTMTPAMRGGSMTTNVFHISDVNVEADDAEGFASELANVGRAALNRRGLG